MKTQTRYANRFKPKVGDIVRCPTALYHCHHDDEAPHLSLHPRRNYHVSRVSKNRIRLKRKDGNIIFWADVCAMSPRHFVLVRRSEPVHTSYPGYV